MAHESTACFECLCGRSYEIPWSQICFGQTWSCRNCRRVIQIVCAEQWEPQPRVICAPKNNVIEMRRAA